MASWSGIGALFAVQGEKTIKRAAAKLGDVVAIAKAEAVRPGEWLGAGSALGRRSLALPARNHALAITTRDRKDDVRLSTALHKLIEEDPALEWEQDEVLHETRLKGDQRRASQGHARASCKRRYGVAVDSRPPTIGYKESIRKTVTQRGRHKKQSGGHGQFGDVVIEVQPAGARRRASSSTRRSPAARCPSNGFPRSRQACATPWPRARSASRWSMSR